MADETHGVESRLDAEVGEFGAISIRVVVLPPKSKAREARTTEVMDAMDGEILPESGQVPLASYLEKPMGGKGSCVFLVNGQRQDSLDNTFIIQKLGFKYLRNRMMIIVDVDGLEPEAIGRLMTGSRQGFYKGNTWHSIHRRLVATLKNDPDLARLEEEAEEQVSELKAGDEKVRNTLDQLIESHHNFAGHTALGKGASGAAEKGDDLGLKTKVEGGVVILQQGDRGSPADYPVLISQPAGNSIRVRPNERRLVTITSQPSNAWSAIASLVIEQSEDLPELIVSEKRLAEYARIELHFEEPDGFDQDQYPLHTTLTATGQFNGIKEPRQLSLRVTVKPDKEPPAIELLDEPTLIRLSSREPVKIQKSDSDTHVRLRWDGKDELVRGPHKIWCFTARCTTEEVLPPTINFSDPQDGRFSLLISPRPEHEIGDELEFEACAIGPDACRLCVCFKAIVVAPPEKREKEPRLTNSQVPSGSIRRPPYDLKYIDRKQYETGTCWGNADWTDEDPGCSQDPTDHAPLTLIINEDMEALREYRQYITEKCMEGEVTRRINKYTSHIAFHLYQMHVSTNSASSDADESSQPIGDVEARSRQEIQRVAMTLIKLMEVSR